MHGFNSSSHTSENPKENGQKSTTGNTDVGTRQGQPATKEKSITGNTDVGIRQGQPATTEKPPGVAVATTAKAQLANHDAYAAPANAGAAYASWFAGAPVRNGGTGSLFEGGGSRVRFDVDMLVGLETMDPLDQCRVFEQLGEIIFSKTHLSRTVGGNVFADVWFLNRKTAQEVVSKAEAYELAVKWGGADVILVGFLLS